MNHDVESALKAWESFYVIVGSSAGALTGLQFVVLTLVTEAGMLRGGGETLAVFGSPNIVHFCSALLISALVSAPWPGHGGVAVAIVLVGALGLLYSLDVMRRATRQRDYQPVLEDWIWHATLPILAYAGLVGAGIALARFTTGALFVVGGASLLLVFIGIHNAWDTVAYVTVERSRVERERAERERTAAAAVAPPVAKANPAPAATAAQEER